LSGEAGVEKAQLERMKQKEEWTQKQLELMTESNKRAYQKCQELQTENRQLSEQLTKLSGLNADGNAVINELKAQVRKLEQGKESLQNEVQIAKTEAQVYREDFALERHDREVAHGMYADLQRKYAYEIGKLEEYHKEKLAEVEHVHQGREKEMRGVLEEASKNQQELQAKTSQVKQYKKQVDSLKDQVVEYHKHNEDLIQEMGKAMSEMEKLKSGKSKKKLSDTEVCVQLWIVS